MSAWFNHLATIQAGHAHILLWTGKGGCRAFWQGRGDKRLPELRAWSVIHRF